MNSVAEVQDAKQKYIKGYNYVTRDNLMFVEYGCISINIEFTVR